MLEDLKLDNILKDWFIANFVDREPHKICACFDELFDDCLCVDSEKMFDEMMNAISNNTLDEFNKKYCEAKMLVIKMNREDAKKSAFQSELVFILNVRKYHKRKTIVVSDERAVNYQFSNEELVSILRPHIKIRE